MGARIRLKSSFDTVNKVGGGTYTAMMQKILRCCATYGCIMADRGGGFRFQGTMDSRWAAWEAGTVMQNEFHTLHLSDFEFIKLGEKPPTGTRRTKYTPTEF